MKKLLAILLSVVLVASLCTVFVFAEDVKYDETQTIDPETGNASFEVAYGFTFSIDYINGTIAGEDVTLVDSADAYANANPNWAISVQLTPVGDLYKVVKVVTTPGSAAAAGIEWGEGDKVLVVHSASSKPAEADLYANWESKVAAIALKAGDVLRVTDTEAYVLMPSEYPYYVTQSVDSETGNASFEVAYGFTFSIDYINGTIAGEDVTLVDSADAYANANPNWAISVQLTPAGDLYEVVKVVTTPGSAAAAGIEWGEGDKVLVVHSASSKPAEAELYANWESKVAAIALKAGDLVAVSETEAYVLMPAEYPVPVKSFNITYANGYDSTATKVYVLASAEEKTTVDILGDSAYQWWYQALLTYDAESEAFEVVKYDNTFSNDYVNWTVGENQLFVMAHDACTDLESLAVLKSDIAVGDKFYLVGDYNALLTASGDVADTYLTTEKVDHWTPSAGEEATDLGKVENADKELAVYGVDSPVTNLNGDVFVFPAGAEDRVVTSDEANLRYAWILVADADGKVVQIGNNLVKASEGKEGFQTEVTVPANGFLVAFFYNADNALNEDLMGIYNAINEACNEGTAIYNETIAVDGAYTLGLNAARDTLYVSNPPVALGKTEGATYEGMVIGDDEYITNLNGDVFVFAAGAEDRVILSDDANLRYSWLLVADADGKIVQIGNNLVKVSEGKEGFQNEVTVPAGGFLLAFVYNATDANYNQDLMDTYNALVDKYNGGTAIYNETIEVDSDFYLGVNAARDTYYVTNGAVEEEPPVEPGDASNMLVFAILALVAVAGSAVVIKTRK